MGASPRSSLRAPDVRSVPVYIYALTDPDGTVRYVGKSANPRGRLSSQYHRSGSGLVREWLAELAARDDAPALRILCMVPPGVDAAPFEGDFIRLHDRGALLNYFGTKAARAPGERWRRADAYDRMRGVEIPRVQRSA